MVNSFLVSQQIAEQISLGIIENGDVEKCIAPASYLLRVGSYLYSPSDKPSDLKLGEAVVIGSREFLLIGTMEKVKFSANMLGFLYLRSSYARRGFLPWSQGIIEPGYHSREPLAIVGGERICHLMFTSMEIETEKPYGSQPDSDVYQNSATATSSKEGNRVKVVGQVGEVVGQMLGGFSRSYLNF
jgi:deoxycytidine triphosphate deaminase